MGCCRIFPPYCTTGGRIAEGGGDYTWGVVVHSTPDASRGERNVGGDVDDSCGGGVSRTHSVDAVHAPINIECASRVGSRKIHIGVHSVIAVLVTCYYHVIAMLLPWYCHYGGNIMAIIAWRCHGNNMATAWQ
jgi:hypothetical protein